MNHEVKIIYPSVNFLEDYLQRYFRYTYYGYLLKGFIDLKLPVTFSEDLNKESKAKQGQCYTIFEVIVDKKKFRVVYDWSDFQWSFQPLLLNEVDFYFKVECNKEQMEEYGVYPIGQGVTDIEKYFAILPALREIKNKQDYKYDVMGLFRATSHKPGLVGDRVICLNIIKKQSWKKLIGISPCSYRPTPPKDLLWSKLYTYHKFLENIAKSKINLLLPGIGELTWRISETLGIGVCSLMPKITTILPGNPKNCWIEVERDYSDLVSKVNYYLKNDKKREQIANNAKTYFEQWLSPSGQVMNIINTIIKEKGK